MSVEGQARSDRPVGIAVGELSSFSNPHERAQPTEGGTIPR